MSILGKRPKPVVNSPIAVAAVGGLGKPFDIEAANFYVIGVAANVDPLAR